RQNGWYVSIRIEDKSIPDYTTKPLSRNCGHIDKSNRDGEKFICTECGYHEHADIGAAKTIRDRALNLVRGDSAKPGVSA
ncbi:zinc ribbon domain-containing protein, partial [Microcoleus sp.]